MSFLQILISVYFLLLPVTAHADYAGPPPVLLEIARCESNSQQFYPNGTLVRDYLTGTHVGIYQISEDWIPIAKKQGWDIYTAEGNTAMAIYLYSKNGTRDWNASKHCWSKPQVESDS